MDGIPDYQSLKSFGCLFYKSTSLKGGTNFDSQDKACVFLGYPIGYKGYQVLDLQINCIFISRHAIFHENIFLFAASSISDTTKAFLTRLARLVIVYLHYFHAMVIQWHLLHHPLM